MGYGSPTSYSPKVSLDFVLDRLRLRSDPRTHRSSTDVGLLESDKKVLT